MATLPGMFPGETTQQYRLRLQNKNNASLIPPGQGTSKAVTPYQTFVGQNAPVTDQGASRLSQDLLANLGKATQSVPSYTAPEKINVGKAQAMPVEYYQSQIDDLSKPLTDQYNLARANVRGDQAARGTIYDSEGYRDIGQLDKSYLDQLGSLTRGVQQQRMQNENQNQQFNITNEMNEALDRRNLGTTSQLQGMGINSNLLNSLLGYGADRYGTEANLFGNIYGSDTDFNKTLLEQQRLGGQDRYDNMLKLLELQGYTDQPQGPLWEKVAEELGYNMQKLGQASQGPQLPDPNSVPVGTKQMGPDGKMYTVTSNARGQRNWV